jgi:hypothetical protein
LEGIPKELDTFPNLFDAGICLSKSVILLFDNGNSMLKGRIPAGGRITAEKYATNSLQKVVRMANHFVDS